TPASAVSTGWMVTSSSSSPKYPISNGTDVYDAVVAVSALSVTAKITRLPDSLEDPQPASETIMIEATISASNRTGRHSFAMLVIDPPDRGRRNGGLGWATLSGRAARAAHSASARRR